LPRVDPAEFESLSLEAFRLVEGFSLHDVWLVELEGSMGCTVQELRSLFTPERCRTLSPPVRILFLVRSLLGRVFRLDSESDQFVRQVAERVPPELANASMVPVGTPEGPFVTLYALPTEAAFQVVNATVHAILIVALVKSDCGHRFFWATYLKPVGRITSLYMRLIDPFRRIIVYPGLESWLKRVWLEGGGLE